MVTMPKKQFIAEHKNLIKILDAGKRLVAEAGKQKRELNEYLRRR